MAWNVIVIGAGAIGCLVGGKLAMAKQQVTLVGRPAFVEEVRARGLQITDEHGAHMVRNLRAAASMLEAYDRSESAFDLAIFTVKSYDTAAAVDELRQALADTGAPPPTLLSLQNGVGNEQLLTDLTAPVIAGSITTPVSVDGPGIIRIDKPSYGVGLAMWGEDGIVHEGGRVSFLFNGVCGLMEMASFAVRPFANAASMKWTKLLMNMMGNATCAILDEAPQQVFADKRMVDMEIGAWREALAVMRTARIAPVDLERYPFSKLAPLIRYAPVVVMRPILRKQIGGARGGKLPSLHIDLHGNKGKSEIRWLNGAVVETGRQLGVATPINTALTETLLRLVEHPEERSGWKGAHARLWAAIQH